MHPNDTLNGRLLEYENADELHFRNKLGYWRMVEDRMITKKLVGLGYDPTNFSFQFLMAREREGNHANDVPMSASPCVSGMSSEFTRSELEYMADMFRDANSPEAQAIYEKVISRLNR